MGTSPVSFPVRQTVTRLPETRARRKNTGLRRSNDELLRRREANWWAAEGFYTQLKQIREKLKAAQERNINAASAPSLASHMVPGTRTPGSDSVEKEVSQ